MAKISASQVKELRDRTGLGMMECKRALLVSDGDVEIAIENLRKNSGLKAAKKAGRTAAEGIVLVRTDATKGVMIEVNCETDFVARDAQFTSFSQEIITAALATSTTDTSLLMQGALAHRREELVQRIGENISLRRIARLEGEQIATYVHSNNKIGVLVAFEGGNASLGKDLAMHIAATSPQALRPEDVSSSIVAKEKALFAAQAEQSGKPPEIIEKMIRGRINKFLAEISFTKQAFVKDPDITIEMLLSKSTAQVHGFIRFEVGEGIEKASEDFADEVRRQAGF